ncbi:hypothetical protein UFOVP816_51 [uncultured Caudovirales phage]|uniref:Scaffolding protein n=1 Tax=uncultured Caudovirales phage TaxID=2100421 RepID=A0A6J5PAN7_9CAUD|nr:hypothetical protein UFOVP816_51 [uncultured Caudovirales phage]
MTAPENKSQEIVTQDTQQSSKEMNFRRQQAMYERMLAEKEARLAELEKAVRAPVVQEPEDDDDDEPYVHKKKLDKKLQKFGQQAKQETLTEVQRAVHEALAKKERDDYVKNNPDFYDTLQNHAETFAQKAPHLAEAILRMPEGFERQQLVYNNIKALGLDRPAQKAPSIQETIDQKRRGPYYQPTGQGAAPYSTATGDFTPSGQKNAYDQMQQLKNRLRL